MDLLITLIVASIFYFKYKPLVEKPVSLPIWQGTGSLDKNETAFTMLLRKLVR